MINDVNVLAQWLDQGFPWNDLRITEDALRMLGWFAAILLPPLGVWAGLTLSRRSDRHGPAIATVAIVMTAVGVALLVSL